MKHTRLSWLQRDLRRHARWFGNAATSHIRNFNLWVHHGDAPADVDTRIYSYARAAAHLAMTAHPELRGVH